MKKLIYSLALIGFLTASANENIDNQDLSIKNIVTQEDVSEHNNEVKALPQEDENVEQAIKRFLKDKGYVKGLNNNGKYKGSGKYIQYHITTVTKDKNDPRFRDSISIAYEKAYFSAQKKLAMDLFGKTITDKAMSRFENNSDNVDEQFRKELQEAKNIAQSIHTIWGKIKTLAHVKLDKELIKEGISAERLKTLSVEKKQLLYKESFIKTTGQEFSGKNLLGTTPIQTYIGMYNGAPAVGVILMKSDKTSIVASDIANKRKPRVSKLQGKSPMDLLPQKDKDYLKEFGVRLFFDENGFPSIISYAQKGVFSRSDKASRVAKAIESAKKKASMAADSQISEFIGVVMSAKDTSKIGEKEQTVLKNRLNKVSGDEEIAEVTTDSIIDILEETAKASSQMDNAGVSEIYDWQAEDELGNKVVGVVRLWSYSQLAAAQRVITGKDIDYGTDDKKKKAMKNIMLKTQGGKDVMNVNDF